MGALLSFFVVVTVYMPIGPDSGRIAEIQIPYEFTDEGKCETGLGMVVILFAGALVENGFGMAQIVDAECRAAGADA